jgi:hypothetical protein
MCWTGQHNDQEKKSKEGVSSKEHELDRVKKHKSDKGVA